MPSGYFRLLLPALLLASASCGPGRSAAGLRQLDLLVDSVASSSSARVVCYGYSTSDKPVSCDVSPEIVKAHISSIRQVKRGPWKAGEQRPATMQWIEVTCTVPNSGKCTFTIYGETMVEYGVTEKFMAVLDNNELEQAIYSHLKEQMPREFASTRIGDDLPPEG